LLRWAALVLLSWRGERPWVFIPLVSDLFGLWRGSTTSWFLGCLVLSGSLYG
jgi:hypothetical protein